jgi:hypothetical protein
MRACYKGHVKVPITIVAHHLGIIEMPKLSV